MPIYAYKCQSCGFAKDVLQKISEPTLTQCPQCAQPTFTKQLTAAGFQLKGSGWYVTDFKGGNNTAADTAKSTTEDASAAPASAPAATPAEPAAAAAPAATTAAPASSA